MEYFGVTKVTDKSIVPEGMYFIERKSEGSWLMALCQMKSGKSVHVGTIDLMDVIYVADKSHLANLKKEEFYEVLKKMFDVDLTGKLYATKDIGNVFSRVASYTKQNAMK